MDDSSIIDLYLVRDQTALTCTVAKYGTRLRSLAENILDDDQSAQECENDTYWQAWRSIPPHEPRTYFFSFLAKITRHLALDCCRRRNRLKRSAQLESLTVELEECIPSGHDWWTVFFWARPLPGICGNCRRNSETFSCGGIGIWSPLKMWRNVLVSAQARLRVCSSEAGMDSGPIWKRRVIWNEWQ